MRTAARPAGVLATFAQQPCSRIPHLRRHILNRHRRLERHSVHSPARPPLYQQFHASTHHQRWKDGAEAPPELSHGSRTEIEEKVAARTKLDDLHTPSSLIGDQGIGTESINVLDQGHPEITLHTLLDPAFGDRFIRKADPDTFAKALTAIDPTYHLMPIKEVYRFMKPALSSTEIDGPMYRFVRPILERFEKFASHLDKVIGIREAAGHKLTLDVYRHLLDCARVMGDGETAEHVFGNMMPDNRVVPDLPCYNYYMEAICWSNAWSPEEQFRLRVTPHLLSIRARRRRPPDLQGHRVARRGFEKGLRYETLSRFKQLAAQGLSGDEATFTNLMVAMGRENDMAGVKSILKSVYNIDVELLQQHDEEEIESPTYYEEDSPLRPTSRLLFTLAHVFGSNNDFSTALQLVDYASRYYNLTIPFKVWMELYEWAFVLHLRRSPVHCRQGQDIGQIDRKMIFSLWDIMTDEPHNIKPDVTLLTLSARASLEYKHFHKTLEAVREAREILNAKRRALYPLMDEVMELANSYSVSPPPGRFFPSNFWNLRRKLILESLELERDLQRLIIAISNLLVEERWPIARSYESRHHTFEWERRALPSLVAEFAEYLPNGLRYRTSFGTIELEGKIERQEIMKRIWGHQTAKLGMIRAALDVDDHDTLEENLKHLPGQLQQFADHVSFLDESYQQILLAAQ